LGPHIQLVFPPSPPYEGEEGGEANYSCVWKHFWRQWKNDWNYHK